MQQRIFATLHRLFSTSRPVRFRANLLLFSQTLTETANDINNLSNTKVHSSKPWYIQDEPEGQSLSIHARDTPKHEDIEAALPSNPPQTLIDVVNHLKTLNFSDFKILDLRCEGFEEPLSAFGGDTVMVICSAKGERHLTVGGEQFVTWVKSKLGTRPRAEGLETFDKYSSLRREKKKKRSSFLELPKDTAKWVCIDMETHGLIIQLFTEDGRAEYDLEDLYSRRLLRRSENPSVFSKTTDPQRRSYSTLATCRDLCSFATEKFDVRTLLRESQADIEVRANSQSQLWELLQNYASNSDYQSVLRFIHLVDRPECERHQFVLSAHLTAIRKFTQETPYQEICTVLYSLDTAFPINASVDLWESRFSLSIEVHRLNSEAFPAVELVWLLHNAVARGVRLPQQVYFDIFNCLSSSTSHRHSDIENCGSVANRDKRQYLVRNRLYILRLAIELYAHAGFDIYDERIVKHIYIASSPILPEDEEIKRQVHELFEEYTLFRSMGKTLFYAPPSSPPFTDPTSFTIESILTFYQIPITPEFLKIILKNLAAAQLWIAFWNRFKQVKLAGLHRDKDMYTLVFSLAAISCNQRETVYALGKIWPELKSESLPVEFDAELVLSVQACLAVADPEVRSYRDLRNELEVMQSRLI